MVKQGWIDHILKAWCFSASRHRFHGISHRAVYTDTLVCTLLKFLSLTSQCVKEMVPVGRDQQSHISPTHYFKAISPVFTQFAKV